MLSALFHRSAASAADFTHLRQASVELRNVVKEYGAQTVLNGVNLAVEPGEVVTILGPSGSGKSTLIRLINQLSRSAMAKSSLMVNQLASCAGGITPATQPYRFRISAIQSLFASDCTAKHRAGAGICSRLE
jgi:ABC-type phosphate/phosphonate transport system ATPase subunit